MSSGADNRSALVVSEEELVAQLRDLGVNPGAVVVVHSAFSRIRPVDGGPLALISALRTAVGSKGTLVMPSMTDEDDVAFDPAASPCLGLGIVAETFWRLPGVKRSDNPHAFAAAGPEAEAIVAPHPVDVPHGSESPIGRVHALDGWVLLLGVGHDANTTVHLAENLAGVRYRLPQHVTILVDGAPTRIDYGEVDHCCERFALLDGWLGDRARQRTGRIGRADARLVRARDVVDVALERLARDETVFLHPLGHDAECDEARRSLPS